MSERLSVLAREILQLLYRQPGSDLHIHDIREKLNEPNKSNSIATVSATLQEMVEWKLIELAGERVDPRVYSEPLAYYRITGLGGLVVEQVRAPVPPYLRLNPNKS